MHEHAEAAKALLTRRRRRKETGGPFRIERLAFIVKAQPPTGGCTRLPVPAASPSAAVSSHDSTILQSRRRVPCLYTIVASKRLNPLSQSLKELCP